MHRLRRVLKPGNRQTPQPSWTKPCRHLTDLPCVTGRFLKPAMLRARKIAGKYELLPAVGKFPARCCCRHRLRCVPGLASSRLLQPKALRPDWRNGAALALKRAATFIIQLDDESWCLVSANAGMGISGAGDVLAGIVTGLAALGLVLHALKGQGLADRNGRLDFLAREILQEISSAMRGF